VTSRRAYRGLYFFEWFALVNFAMAMLLLGGAAKFDGSTLLLFAVNLAAQALVAIAIRATIAYVRRDDRYFRRIRSAGWISDTLRLIVFGALITYTYGWIKLVVPLRHPRLFDQELWNLDQAMLFGISPNILMLNLFSNPTFLKVIDFSYAGVFFVSMIVAWSYFLSEPSRRLRVAFSNGNALLWISGAWLYMLVPSLGPAYRFPEMWFAHAEVLGRTQYFQSLLMRNYNDVLREASGQPAGAVQLMFGIGAFPSLHVGFQTYALLWMRKLWTSGEVLFAIFALTIFLGSMLTGWHYLIDGIAGIAMAVLAYWATARAARTGRWLKLRTFLPS
jgi:hypothetical protein